MVKSKTKISKQVKRKTNTELAETILVAKKHPAWLEISGILSGPRRKRLSLNLNEVDSKSKNSGKVLIPGKVLSMGDVSKKLKIVALSFSEKAKEKLLKAGCEVKTMLEEIKSNPEAKGIEVLK